MPSLIDEVGKRYGRLIVIGRAGSTPSKQTLWRCKCDCGKETFVTARNLRAGRTRSCGCLKANAMIDEIGKRHGRLTIIEQAGKKNKLILWRCKCDCGKETFATGVSLRRGKTRSCGCLQKENLLMSPKKQVPPGVAALRKVFRQLRRNAALRGYVWALPEDEVKRMIDSPCHYCGMPPSNLSKNTYGNGDYCYNGIDRLDNSKGYISDNVVPCCSECNKAKGTRSYQEFMEWLGRVIALREQGKRFLAPFAI